MSPPCADGPPPLDRRRQCSRLLGFVVDTLGELHPRTMDRTDPGADFCTTSIAQHNGHLGRCGPSSRELLGNALRGDLVKRRRDIESHEEEEYRAGRSGGGPRCHTLPQHPPTELAVPIIAGLSKTNWPPMLEETCLSAASEKRQSGAGPSLDSLCASPQEPPLESTLKLVHADRLKLVQQLLLQAAGTRRNALPDLAERTPNAHNPYRNALRLASRHPLRGTHVIGKAGRDYQAVPPKRV